MQAAPAKKWTRRPNCITHAPATGRPSDRPFPESEGCPGDTRPCAPRHEAGASWRRQRARRANPWRESEHHSGDASPRNGRPESARRITPGLSFDLLTASLLAINNPTDNQCNQGDQQDNLQRCHDSPPSLCRVELPPSVLPATNAGMMNSPPLAVNMNLSPSGFRLKHTPGSL